MYRCDACDYSTTKKYNFNKHFQTKKHAKNIARNLVRPNANIDDKNPGKKGRIPPNCSKSSPKCSNIAPICSKIPPKCSKSSKKIREIRNRKFTCEYCQKLYLQKYSLKRHYTKCKEGEGKDSEYEKSKKRIIKNLSVKCAFNKPNELLDNIEIENITTQ